jgi:hypothetical protein
LIHPEAVRIEADSALRAAARRAGSSAWSQSRCCGEDQVASMNFGGRAGARGGARGQPQMREDLANHSGLLDGGDGVQCPAAVRTMRDVDVEDAF